MSGHVSVIIPTYNGAAYIRDALDSVLAQTYQSFHITVVDDGSTDETVSIVREYVEKYTDQVSLLVPEKKLRAAGCRMYAVAQTEGQYLAFIDQDDRWLPEKLALQVEAAAAGATIVHTNIRPLSHPTPFNIMNRSNEVKP